MNELQGGGRGRAGRSQQARAHVQRQGVLHHAVAVDAFAADRETQVIFATKFLSFSLAYRGVKCGIIPVSCRVKRNDGFVWLLLFLARQK